ncbi:MAG: magnesium/cobalt transporter CorA [Nanoarchaeota archaeon]|nr:magnesium/cobalt transporter CorA [Nanoarchaeota archaeon]
MFKYMKKNSKKFGTPPGTLIYTGESKKLSYTISLISYNVENFKSSSYSNFDDFENYFSKFKNVNDNKQEHSKSNGINWIQVEGISNIDLIQNLGTFASIHQLNLEDIVSVNQRPKFEEGEDYVLCILQIPHYNEDEKIISYSQLSLILKNSLVISFEESKNIYTKTIKERIELKKGRVRSMNSDYLFYVLIDIIFDGYFKVIDILNEKLEVLEEELITNPTKSTLNELYKLRREILFLRKLSWSNKELVSNIYHLDSKLFSKKLKPFLKDVYDHSVQILDLIETKRELISTMLDLYQSSLANKTNEVMKVLTMFASIFIPLTFIAGIYGMNFEYMPELAWKFGYFGVWGIFIIVSVSLIVYFKRKNWI